MHFDTEMVYILSGDDMWDPNCQFNYLPFCEPDISYQLPGNSGVTPIVNPENLTAPEQ